LIVDLVKHHKKIQDFRWKLLANKFGLILGWWNLCYLNDKDMGKYLKGANISLISGGCIILTEPILDENCSQSNNHNG
jgi:hypothetical protein